MHYTSAESPFFFIASNVSWFVPNASSCDGIAFSQATVKRSGECVRSSKAHTASENEQLKAGSA